MRALLFWLVITGLLTACMTIQVTESADNHFDAAKYHRYAWWVGPVKASGRDSLYYNVDTVVRDLVVRELSSRGFQQVSKAEADFLVEYHFLPTVTADQGGVISPTNEARSAWESGRDINNTALQNHYIPAQIVHGRLQINLNDSTSGAEVWQASAVTIIEQPLDTAGSVKAIMKKIIPKLLNGLPARD